jgi:hypothetical protein
MAVAAGGEERAVTMRFDPRFVVELNPVWGFNKPPLLGMGVPKAPPLSPQLAAALDAWADEGARLDELRPIGDDGPTSQAELDWAALGYQLALRLRKELPEEFDVWYQDDVNDQYLHIEAH